VQIRTEEVTSHNSSKEHLLPKNNVFVRKT